MAFGELAEWCKNEFVISLFSFNKETQVSTEYVGIRGRTGGIQTIPSGAGPGAAR